jgi:hypothetical protein
LSRRKSLDACKSNGYILDHGQCQSTHGGSNFCFSIDRFCRGGSCNRCGETAYLSLTNPAIDKLHSTWIDESILAMQRPNDALMKDSNLIEQFQSNGIVAIFNLTEPGEHPYCGGGNLKESGFPYHPEKLMAAGSE